MIHAIVLGGKGAIKDLEFDNNKALYKFNNRTMIEYVIDALNAVKEIDKIVLVGDTAKFSSLNLRVERILEPSDSLIENIKKAYRYLGHNSDLLICCSDIPLITPIAIEDFILKSQTINADASYPMIKKSILQEAYPDMIRSYFTVKDGTFTAGNMYYVKPKALDLGLSYVENLYKYRKNPFKMAKFISLKLMLELLFGTLTIDKVERRILNMSKLNGRAVISDFPEMGCDVDKLSDVIVTQHYLSKIN